MASGARIISKAISGYTIARILTKSKPKLTRGSAIVDIFKLEDRKVVEHWDVIQPIPENAVNQNGMF
jgi:predicted SnoaL-like aldol condensation-catalyzing enzyme